MPKETKSSRLLSVVIALLVVTALGAGAYLLYHDRAAPQISLDPLLAQVSRNVNFTVSVNDETSAIKSLRVTVQQGTASITLLERTYPAGQVGVSETFSLPEKGLDEGELRLVVSAVDSSLAHFGKGNTGQLERTLTLDTRPPQISTSSGIVHITQGGSGFIVFTVSEKSQDVGVVAGDYFFPAHQQGNGQYWCLFAFPYTMDAADYEPMLTATDMALNTTRRTFTLDAKPVEFPHDTINLSDGFLEKKMPEFESVVPGQMTPIERFLKVNRDLRVENRERLYQLGQDTAPARLWAKTFLRMEGDPRARFADHRTYMYDGQEVDKQVHLGADIAHLKNTPVPAANDGRVAWAGYIGIYGNCVVIDHGLGLQTLYAHLSEITVAQGDVVERGQSIGKTGISGMAGGDHLHFGVTVAGLPVSPLEWWDSHWIKDNFEIRLQ